MSVEVLKCHTGVDLCQQQC